MECIRLLKDSEKESIAGPGKGEFKGEGENIGSSDDDSKWCQVCLCL